MIRLLFVDDHPIVAEGLVSRFRATDGFSVVASVTTMERALAITEPVDVALVDVQLEVLTTPEQVAALTDRCRVVLFSARGLDQYVRSLLDAGASANQVSPQGETVLDIALRIQLDPLVDLILDRKGYRCVELRIADAATRG